MILKQKNIAIAVVAFALLVLGCRRDKVDNPYEEIDYTVANDNPSPQDIPSDNFAYLHAKIFRPTCANAGCHDGTFEPEFRSVASSYNTLVNHPVIANDAQNSYEYRVVPGSVENSFLHLRLTESIPNTTGMMPPEVDPDSDWPQYREDYIDLIENWIASGAPDMFGNPAPSASNNFPATVEGLAVFPAGNTTDPYQRDESEVGITPILVDPATVDIWILATDDSTPQQDISAQVEIATSLEEFDEEDLAECSTAGSLQALDFFDNSANFQHKATVDLSSYQTGDVLFVKCYVSDGEQAFPQEIPSEGSSQQIVSIFILKII
ncbi:hypothetical protein [Halocola ammonii]